MAELKAEWPEAPLVLAVAPVMMMVPSPLDTILRDTFETIPKLTNN